MDKIKNQKLFCFHKNNLKKKQFTKIYNLLEFLLILLFHILFKETYEQFKIDIVAKNQPNITCLKIKTQNSSCHRAGCNSHLCNVTIIFDNFVNLVKLCLMD